MKPDVSPPLYVADAQELVLHVLHENGQVQLQDLESHIKDDIERESAKISDNQRKMRTAYAELTTAPVIEDDMLLADEGQMLQQCVVVTPPLLSCRHTLTHLSRSFSFSLPSPLSPPYPALYATNASGDFAEDLGEDFLGLRELGIDKEFGLSSVSVPKSLFFGRRRRDANAALGPKTAEPDYPPPLPFIPLTAATYKFATPGLLHAFYAERLEGGGGLDADDAFDPVHSSIGPLGQIVVKAPQSAPTKKGGGKKDAEEKKEKKPAKKTG